MSNSKPTETDTYAYTNTTEDIKITTNNIIFFTIILRFKFETTRRTKKYSIFLKQD